LELFNASVIFDLAFLIIFAFSYADSSAFSLASSSSTYFSAILSVCFIISDSDPNPSYSSLYSFYSEAIF